MGTTKLSEAELASRIRPDRYELAAKSEVFAFVKQRVNALAKACDEEIEEAKKEAAADRKISEDMLHGILAEHLEWLTALQRRVAVLELTRWQRFKRAFLQFVEDTSFAVLSLDDRGEMEANAAAAAAIEADMREADMRTEQAEDLETHPALLEAIAEMQAHPPTYDGELTVRFPTDAGKSSPFCRTPQLETLGDPEE